MTHPLPELPKAAAGLCLCKTANGRSVICEEVIFTGGLEALRVTLSRAALAGRVGPLGETGTYWADVLDAKGDMIDNLSLDRDSWNSLKNHWMRCRVSINEPLDPPAVNKHR